MKATLFCAATLCAASMTACGDPPDATGTLHIVEVAGGQTWDFSPARCALVPTVINLDAAEGGASAAIVIPSAAEAPAGQAMSALNVTIRQGSGQGTQSVQIGSGDACTTFTSRLTRTGTGAAETVAGDVTLDCSSIRGYSVSGTLNIARCVGVH